jgi:hypothetical protein
MKITKSQLKQIIKEELNEMLPLAIRMGQRRQQITGATASDVAAKEQIVDWFKQNGDVYGNVLEAIPGHEGSHNPDAGPETDETGFYEDLNEFFLDKDLPAILNSMLRHGLLNDWDGREHRALDTVRRRD